MSHWQPPPKWFCGGGLPPHEQSMASVYSRNVRLSTEKSLLQSCRASVRAVENQEAPVGHLPTRREPKHGPRPRADQQKWSTGADFPARHTRDQCPVLVVLDLFWRYCAKILTVGAVLVVLTSIRTNFVGETK